MEGVVSKVEVECFLKEARTLLNQSNGFQFIKRRKNLDSMSKYGLSIETVKMYIEHIQIANYSQGPVEDRDFSGFVWIFGKRISGMTFYIKLKIKNGRLLCCLSFHEAEYPIYYPYG